MRYLFLIMIILFSSNVHATNVCPDTDGSQVEKIFWNENKLRSGCLLIPNSSNSFLSSIPRRYLKISGTSVVEMTQSEKDAVDQAIADAQKQAETDRINKLEDKLQAIQTGDFPLTKIDNAIDNIQDLNDAKAFLKKLVRGIIKLNVGFE